METDEVSGSGARDSNADQGEVRTRVNLLKAPKQVAVSVAGGATQAQAQVRLSVARQRTGKQRFQQTQEQVQVRLAFSHCD